jgi:UDPglucose 6-dehydrogenase
MDAVKDADALLIVTEWKVFRSPNFDALKTLLKNPVVFDGRNLYEPHHMRELDFEYYPIGRLA